MARILILASISKAFRNFSFELLEAMRAANFEVIISIPEDPLNADFRSIGCQVIPAPLSRHGMNPLAELKLISEYRRLFRVYRPDAVLTYTIKPNSYGGIVARMSGVPYLATITGLGTTFYNDSPVNRVIRGLLKAGLGGACCVLFQNEFNRDLLLKRGFIKHKHRMVPGSGVNLIRHSCLPYPVKDDKVRFLLAARAQKEKGVTEFIEAAERIRKDHPECEFHFAGLSEEKEYADKIAAACKHGVLIDHGFLDFDALRSLMQTIHAVVLPSYHEGMSNTLLEAAAAGRPILASDIPGCRETMDPDRSGFLFQPQSADSLVQALTRFLALPPESREVMGLAGRSRVETHFDRTQVVCAYMEEIDNILG